MSNASMTERCKTRNQSGHGDPPSCLSGITILEFIRMTFKYFIVTFTLFFYNSWSQFENSIKRFFMRVKTWHKKNLLPCFLILTAIMSLGLDTASVNAFTDSSPIPLPFDDPSVWPDSNSCSNCPQKLNERTFFLKKNRQEQKARDLQIQLQRQLQELSQRQNLKRVHKPSAIEITYQDMVNTYAFNADFLEYYAYPKNITMDMGNFDPDLATPQNWVMPNGLD